MQDRALFVYRYSSGKCCRFSQNANTVTPIAVQRTSLADLRPASGVANHGRGIRRTGGTDQRGCPGNPTACAGLRLKISYGRRTILPLVCRSSSVR
jgi:hypothetical protein